MKGYLSNIARQSGLRFSVGREPGRKAAGKRKVEAASEPVTPLEHEEVVMVRPRLGERTKRPAALAAESSKSEMRTSRNKTEAQGAELASQKSEVPAESDLGKPPTRQAAPLISPRKIRTGLAEPAKTGRSMASEVETVLEQNEPASEQTVFVEQPKTIGESKPQAAEIETASLRTVHADRVISGPQAPGRESDQRYFTRTAQLIDGQQAAPEEARTILLHEIQEWVAAGASPDVEIVSRIEQMDAEARETQEVVKTFEPEPGVVRIREKHVKETATAEAHRQSADIEEQNFDLSIGTISVVIEGGDRPAQSPVGAGQPQPATQNSLNDAGDRFSRLSRSYL